MSSHKKKVTRDSEARGEANMPGETIPDMSLEGEASVDLELDRERRRRYR